MEKVDKKMKENVEEVKRGIGFIITSLANVGRELMPEPYYSISVTMGAFSTLHKRIEFVRKCYVSTIQDLERIEQFYPIEKRNNILKKIKIVKNALESLVDAEKTLNMVKAKLQDMPVKLFD